MNPRLQRTKERLRWRSRLTYGSVALAGILVFATATPAHADYYSGGMPGKSFNVRYIGINPTWTSQFDTSRARWNLTAGTGISIGKKSDAAATMTAAQYNESWYGLYSPSGIRGVNRAFAIKVNARTLSRDSGANMSQWMDSTSTHEIGHALSLNDNPNTSQASLMKHSRNRTAMVAPQPYDIAEVKRIY